MADYELDEIHRIRREISERFNHDPEKLGAYYRALDQEFRKAGYKFADLPAREARNPRNRTTKKLPIDFESLEGYVLRKAFSAHTLIATGTAVISRAINDTSRL